MRYVEVIHLGELLIQARGKGLNLENKLLMWKNRGPKLQLPRYSIIKPWLRDI